MKKPYSLDFSIEKESDRLIAVQEILDTLEKDPSASELEQMASYILYGKDDDGYNAVQRGEITNSNTRYGSYKRKDDKLLSLDEILENPATDQQDLQLPTKKSVYTNKKPSIKRPKYDKAGNLTDIGDADIPHMEELWESIDRLEHVIAVAEGRVPADENTPPYVDGYRLYQMKHILIDLRRHQYYLKDTYKPVLHFPGVDHPKAQFIDWSSDCYYWITEDEWRQKLEKSYDPYLPRTLDAYERRADGKIKWIVREHHFDWENPLHVRALINNYDALYDFLYEKLDTYGRTLIFDFERYREMAHLTEVRGFILSQKIARVPYSEITMRLRLTYGLTYNENHLSTILAKEIPQQIADAARRHRLLIETPQEECKKCYTCGRYFPRDSLFFTHNRSRKDGLSSNCKECERRRRIERGG